MHVFKHPKYYKELRKRNKSDQAISKEPATAGNQRSPGPGLKLQAREDIIHEENERLLDRSSKPQAASIKLQAASYKLPDFFPLIKFFVLASGIKN